MAEITLLDFQTVNFKNLWAEAKQGRFLPKENSSESKWKKIARLKFNPRRIYCLCPNNWWKFSVSR